MKSSKVLRRAAKLVEDGVCGSEFSAIAYASSYRRIIARKANRRMGKHYALFFYGRHSDPSLVVGLCFAAAIAESEGD